MNNTWTTTTEEDADGNVILTLPEEMLKQADWREGDDLDFQVNADDTCTITNLTWQKRQDEGKVA